MNYVTYAVPFFVLAVLVEFLYGWLRRSNTYRLADTINSLQLGTLSRLRGIVQLGLMGVVFETLVRDWTLFELDASHLGVWVFAFVAYDLGYYFSHRYGHEWRILWASHVVHHSSEEYNLSTALRQTSTGWLNGIFYLPLYIIGVPVELMISVGSLNLIYQFWVHTKHVKRLGALEWIMVTPSNHRVHHAKNPCYIDRNYGGVFIIWDRIFGTFQEELDEQTPRYGITRQLHSWNPLWANLHAWYDGLVQMWQTPKLTDKVKLWFKSPAWTAPGVTTASADWQAPNYDPAASAYARALSFIHFWPHVAAVFALLAFADVVLADQVLCCAAWLCLGFYVQGTLLEGRAFAHWLEWLRIGSAGALLLWLAPSDPYLIAGSSYLALSILLNIGLIRTTISDDRLQSPG
jgi:sterol desaturase/sphingolipid hydroxylase (fatty acid hydroxylase superfamily)